VAVSLRDFSLAVRRNPLAASRAGLERLDLGIKRLLNVLDREQVSAIRTLEMKISDAGPTNQRIDPHILGLAGVEAVERGRVSIHRDIRTATHAWYAPARLGIADIQPKLDVLIEAYLATTSQPFTSALGDPLEISVFKILRRLKAADQRFTFLGSYDLSARQANGRFGKTEPTVNFNEAVLEGPPDFVIFDPRSSGEPGMIECKNLREWLYPSKAIMKAIVRKALAANMTPILIARRIPYIAKAALCEPAGIIAHETYHQLYPETDHGRDLAAIVRDNRGLGYFDVMASEEPLPRTVTFFERNLPKLLPIAAAKFRHHAPSLHAWVNGTMSWQDLRRRLAGRYLGADEEMDI
jgi:hypothetical protein